MKDVSLNTNLQERKNVGLKDIEFSWMWLWCLMLLYRRLGGAVKFSSCIPNTNVQALIESVDLALERSWVCGITVEGPHGFNCSP